MAGNKHPGVVIIRRVLPSGAVRWQLRYRDPDTNKFKLPLFKEPVARDSEGPPRAVVQWAVETSKTIARRRRELESGAPRATGTSLRDAIGRYFKDHARLRPKTVQAYRGATDKLEAWAAGEGIDSADDLTRAHLLSFRAELANAPKQAPIAPELDDKGKPTGPRAKRGAKQATDKARSAHSVNRELRSLRTVLGYVRDLDLLPKVSHDDLRRALKRMSTEGERAEYLKVHELQALLDAALRHDADTVISRAEEADIRAEAKARGVSREAMRLVRPRGTTPRFDPVSSFVAFVLLTGMRVGEAIELTWDSVDLDALDHDGNKVGEIHLAGSKTKTKKARTVGLEVSPALHKILSALHLASGGKGRVFAITNDEADAAAKRLRKTFGAPQAFGWQMLRSTCATFLTNAPGIFGAASAYRSAKQLGHSVIVAEKHYTDVMRGIPREARTLEAAMQIEEHVGRVIASLDGKAEVRQVRQLPIRRKAKVSRDA